MAAGDFGEVLLRVGMSKRLTLMLCSKRLIPTG